MVYVVRVACHIYLDIYLDIHLNIHLNIHLDVYLDIHLNVYLNVYRNVHRNVHLNIYLTLPPPHLDATPLHDLAPQSVNAIKVHSLLLPSSSTVNLRS